MAIPQKLQTIIDVFNASPTDFRVEALLDYSRRLPELPPRFADNHDLLEAVPECQTPFFLATEVDDDGTAHLFFDAPPQAPTVRGYASILSDGLDGEKAQTILDIPDDFYMEMGLEEVVTPLRLRGMSAIVHRLKSQLRAAVET